MTVSDVPIACPQCGAEYLLFNVCEETETDKVITCGHCNHQFTISEGNQLFATAQNNYRLLTILWLDHLARAV